MRVRIDDDITYHFPLFDYAATANNAIAVKLINGTPAVGFNFSLSAKLETV
jgi:hypothetical protein